MENKRLRMLAVALMGIVITSLGAVGLASSLSNKAGTYQTGVFGVEYGFGEWKLLNVTEVWTELLRIRLPDVPIGAFYYVLCDGHAWCDGGMLQIAIGVDAPVEDDSTRRFIHSAELLDNPSNIHTERLYHLGPGAHTFYFLGKLYQASPGGYVNINYHSITVIIFTDGRLMELVESGEGSNLLGDN